MNTETCVRKRIGREKLNSIRKDALFLLVSFSSPADLLVTNLIHIEYKDCYID